MRERKERTEREKIAEKIEKNNQPKRGKKKIVSNMESNKLTVKIQSE